MQNIEMTTKVQLDDAVVHASSAFDFEFDGTYKTTIKRMPAPPKDFGVGVLYGSSGSGKSSLLKTFGRISNPSWERDMAIVSQFQDAEDAIARLTACGLNDIPSWVKPFHALSNGQQFRANLAMQLGDGALIDEFTSVVNRSVAKSASVAISRYAKTQGLSGIVLATCHEDVLDYLDPDWTYNTDTCEMRVGRYLRRPVIQLGVYRSSVQSWSKFAKHHYLSGEINAAAECFVAVMDGGEVGFSAVLPMPSGTLKNAFREHRTVLLPDFQGMGIGVRFSDAIADIQAERGRRYFSKTTHPRMGAYRNASKLWRATCKNGVKRTETGMNTDNKLNDTIRINTTAYSHEYIGHNLKGQNEL